MAKEGLTCAIFVALACHKPALNGSDWHYQAPVHCSKPCCQSISVAQLEKKILEMLRIEPGPAVWEARMLPLCDPSSVWQNLQLVLRSERDKKFFSHQIEIHEKLKKNSENFKSLSNYNDRCKHASRPKLDQMRQLLALLGDRLWPWGSGSMPVSRIFQRQIKLFFQIVQPSSTLQH